MPRHAFPLLAVLLLPLAVPASAQPDAATSTFPNVILEPTGLLETVVVIRNASGVPLGGVQVDLLFSPAADGILCWCGAQAHPLISADTDDDGRAVFNVQGAGCADPAFVGPPVVEVFAAGAYMTDVGVVSPAPVDLNGVLPWNGWIEGAPPCQTSLADAVYLYGFLSNRSYNFCADIDSDGKVGLSDIVLVTQSIIFATTCN